MLNKKSFAAFAGKTATYSGHPSTFLGAIVIVLAWAVCGPVLHYSDTWQLVINTLTSIVTFIMVFLIQNTQNREIQALTLKLDELIRASSAHNSLLDIEKLNDDQLAALRERYEKLAKRARGDLKDEPDQAALSVDKKKKS